MPRSNLIAFRRDTAANWTSTNPTLAAGEPGWETDTKKLKIGDGATAWTALAYFSPSGSGGSVEVTDGTHTVTAATELDFTSGATVTDGGGGLAEIAISVGGSAIPLDGWEDDTAETWTYASGSGGGTATFTVAGDKRTKYSMGTRIKLTQTTVKYFVVSADPTYDGTNTTVTITGGSDYTLANAAISANFHSYVVNPQGYPHTFNYTPVFTGFSADPTVGFARFSITGRLLFTTIFLSATGTSNATTLTVTVAATLPNTDGIGGWVPCQITDNGTVQTSPGLATGVKNSNTISVFKSYAFGAWTAAGAKGFNNITHWQAL